MQNDNNRKSEMPDEETDRETVEPKALGSVIDPVLADFLTEFRKHLSAAKRSSELNERNTHYKAIWNACSVSRSIRLHLGVLANAENSDATATSDRKSVV